MQQHSTYYNNDKRQLNVLGNKIQGCDAMSIFIGGFVHTSSSADVVAKQGRLYTDKEGWVALKSHTNHGKQSDFTKNDTYAMSCE